MNMMKFRSVPTLAFAAMVLASSPSFAKNARKSARSEDSSSPTTLALGASLPLSDVKMKSVDGKEITLAGVAGKSGTLVVFTCNHCPWAKAWQDRIAALGNAAQEKGVSVVAVNSNDPKAYPEDSFEDMQKRAKSVGFKFAYVVDGTSDVARAFGAAHTPEAFLFDARGKLVYHGAVDDNAHKPEEVKNRWLQDAVTAVEEGKPVAVSESKALGCGIKYRQKS